MGCEITLAQVHPDMSRYLKNNENIYDISNCPRPYTPGDICVVIAQNEEMTVVVTDLKEYVPQCIIIWHNYSEVFSTRRIDAVENNVSILTTLIN